MVQLFAEWLVLSHSGSNLFHTTAVEGSVAPSSRKTLVPTCYCGMDLIMPIMLAYEPQLLRSPLCGRLSGHRFGAPPGPGFFLGPSFNFRALTVDSDLEQLNLINY